MISQKAIEAVRAASSDCGDASGNADQALFHAQHGDLETALERMTWCAQQAERSLVAARRALTLLKQEGGAA
jgi:cellobiose-specific phosphotransferase system component IIA